MNRFYAFITDRVLIALVLAFSVLAVLDQSQAFQSLRFSLKSMLEIAPFFILAIAFAGFAKATGIDAHIARVFSGKSWITIEAASLAGALSPFCSCGVIPLIAAFFKSTYYEFRAFGTNHLGCYDDLKLQYKTANSGTLFCQRL